MTTRYSRREGAPLQEWAGENEGCWATARPAAPPPAPSRDALAKSTSSPPWPPPRANPRPFVSFQPPRPPTLTRRCSPFHPGHTTDQRCTWVLFFVIPLLTLLSFLSPFPRTLVRSLSRSFIVFFISRVVRVRSARLALVHRVSFASRR